MSREGWFAPSFHVPDDVKQRLHQYAQTLPWPEGSTLNDPQKYHVTGMYSPEGYQDPANAEWIASHQGVTHDVSPAGIESFADSPSQKGYPVVLRLNGDSIHQHGEQLHNEGEQRGLEVSRFPGGYKPHITLGYSPEPLPPVEPPRDQFKVGPLYDLHADYDRIRQAKRSSTGWDTADFFTDVGQGAHRSRIPLQPEDVSQDPDHQRLYERWLPFASDFDRHIETSIPDYRSLQLDKAHSLLQQPGGRLLDIAGGSGAWNKLLSQESNGAWQTDNLEPNANFVEHFHRTPVEGARSVPEAFLGDYGDIPQFQGTDPYDVIHESMGLQFIGPDKHAQTQEVKRLLRPGGLYITDQKFTGHPNEAENERVKDEWKAKYYTPDQLYEKNKQVGFQGDDEGTMMSNLSSQDDYHKLLKQHFKHVEPYWQSGNFGGFVASDDPEHARAFLGGLKRGPHYDHRISSQLISTGHKRMANILDPIHPGLPAQVWDDPKGEFPVFKPHHKDWLLKTAIGVLHKGGYEGIENYISFVVTGSIATYQYSPRSDVDTSVFIDFEQFPEWSRAEMIGLFVDELDGVKLPGTTYDLQLFVQPPEIKPEMIFQPGLRSGYLLDEDRWIVPPDRSRVHDIEKEMHDVYTYALETADKMERLITYEPQKAVMFWEQLHRRRRDDQRRHKGDFAPSNVAYKFVVNRGLTERLGEIMGKKIVL